MFPLTRFSLALSLCALSLTVRADEASFSGEIGAGVIHSQTVVRGAQGSTAPLPYLAFDYGPLFARIDTFGVKTLKAGYGHLELIGRYRAEGYLVEGLERRSQPVPLGLGSLQVTPVGAFEAHLLRDFGASAGRLLQARYVARLRAGRFSFYPELGAEYLDARYADYYYGTRGGDAASLGRSWAPGAALNPFAGLLLTTKLGERWALNGYLRYTRLDDRIAASPLVTQRGRSTMFLVVARKF